MLMAVFCSAFTSAASSVAYARSNAIGKDEFPIFMPLVMSNRSNAQPPPTASPTPTATPSPTPPPSNGQLPTNLVGTWFAGNAPLNDFYNPTTGEWRSVSGLGQMYVFGGDGSFTYTGFFRIETGACRSEVSVYRHGRAEANANTLTLTPDADKTRTVITCPTPKETIVEGPHTPLTITFVVGEDNSGREQLSVHEGNSDTNYARSGMAASLVGVWKSATLTPQGFYDATNDQFDLNSPMGMWFRFNADATYEFGEHNQTPPDDSGCVSEFWIYQKGTITVNGGQIAVAPKTGTLRLMNQCNPDGVTQNPWLDNTRTYVWLYRDRDTTDIKLVMIPLERYVEFTFSR